MEVDINTAGNDDGGQENTDPAPQSQDDHVTEGSAEDRNSNDVHVITGLDDIVEAQSHNEALPTAEEDQEDQPVNGAGNIEGKELIETFGKTYDLTRYELQYHFTVVRSSFIMPSCKKYVRVITYYLIFLKEKTSVLMKLVLQHLLLFQRQMLE